MPKFKKGILLSILFAITLFFGTKIRILALIAPIACGIFVLLRGNFRFIKEKAFYQNLIVIAVVFLLCVTADRMLLNRLSLVTDSSAAFPAQHWLMMGFSENGSYNPEDEQFSLDFSTKEERIVEDTNVLKERIHTLGFSGIIRLWKEKLALTWSDGYDDYADNLTLARDYRMLNSYLSGGRSELLTGIMHCYHTGISLLLMLCALLAFFRKTPDCMFVIFLSVLGGMIFHLFWESGEAYSMPFALLIVAAASGGLDFPKLTQHKSSGLLLILPLTAMLGLLAMLAPVLFRQPFQIREFAAVQDLSDGDDILLKEGDVISQTFSAALPFDRLKIYSKYISGSSKPALAMLTLLDENQRIIHEELLENENSFYNAHTCQFNEIIPNDTETFTIQLTVLELPEDTEYSFLTYHTGNIDVYPNGMLLKNQLYTPNADLNFIVYRDVNKTFL